MHHSFDLVKKQKLFNNRMSDTSYELWLTMILLDLQINKKIFDC
jgi:hypothetical protein